MLDNEPNDTTDETASGAVPAQQPPDSPPDTPGTSTDPVSGSGSDSGVAKPAKKATAKKAAKAPAKKAAAKKTAKKTTKAAEDVPDDGQGDADLAAGSPDADADTAEAKPKKKAAPRKKAAARKPDVGAAENVPETGAETDSDSSESVPVAPMVLFKAPEPTRTPRKRAAKKSAAKPDDDAVADVTTAADAGEAPDSAESEQGDERPERGNRGQGGRGRGGQGRNRGGAKDAEGDADAEPGDQDQQDDSDDDGTDGEGGPRRRRRRGGRRRRKPSDGDGSENAEDQTDDSDNGDEQSGDSESEGEGNGSRRRRRRRRTGEEGDASDDPENTVTRARRQRNPEDEITSISGSTRLEAKKQRRRDGREAGRRRAPIVSEAEFLARRESVDRVMVIRQKNDLTQIGVLEDKVLVEHYVARESQTSLIGNVYLGRVQNVLPSMEAAFIDIGKGRNAVLYAGEVNWAALGHKDGQARKIESVLSSGQTILVQVSKDPVGHKGARLTGQISLPGRFLVYVPDGNTSGISRKLPDTERNRLKTLLKQIVPDTAGVIVRTAAEGASEEELTVDVERLTARWNDIEGKVKAGKSPQLLYGEPDLTLKVVRDLFTEDFAKLVVQGDDAWDLVQNYVSHVAPDLAERLERYEPGESGKDVFASYRVDEQIAKGLDRKVWLPSGGSLVIDRTEAMTVVDVNTGKFTGSGGNLEETVTKNNLEAAEEMVRQLRLRDIGGIIVIDFIDMVLESNRDLVLRRLVECLGRDRTRHQVAEVTSLGLVQMTRKRIGTGLLEAFSTDCEHCKGRGLITHEHPVEGGNGVDEDEPRGRRGRSGRNRGRGAGDDGGNRSGGADTSAKPSPADLAKTRPPEKSDDADVDVDVDDAASHATAPAATDGADTSADDRGTEEQKSPAEESRSSRSGRRDGRRRAERPAGQPAEQVAAEAVEQPVQPSAEPSTEDAAAPKGARETAAAAEEPAGTDPAPVTRVVTTTRRRTARRPAGPPTGVTDAAPDTVTGTSTAPTEVLGGAGKQAGPSAEPLEVPVEPAGVGQVSGDRDSSSDEAHTDDLGNEDPTGAGSLMHVPIKRKGSRKR